MLDEQLQSVLVRALGLGAGVLGTTSPNPPVGAVVLDADGQVVGEGATQPPGGPHAEVVALRRAGERARGGTLVCTLEPCRHTGRTGPCTTAVIGAGLARVVHAAVDPGRAAGGGAAVLRAAGVVVEQRPLPPGSALEGWLTAQRTGRPFVTWKFAATLDGRSAAADGSSRWITSEVARADVHRLRAECDAVAVGVGTVLADDPQLTVRPSSLLVDGHQPLRVVVDSRGRAPRTARVFDGAAETVHAVVGATADGALVLPAGPDGRVDLGALLQALQDRGVVSVLLEGGPVLAAAFLRAGLVDRVVAYLAPALLGAGPPALGDLGAGTISAALRLRLDETVQLGGDVRLTLRPG